jgi:hypothetical protein
MKAFFRALVALFLAGAAPVVFAQAGGVLSSVTKGHVWSSSGGTLSVGVLSDGGGTYSATVPAGTATARTIGGTIASDAVAGSPVFRTVENATLAGGRTIPVTVVNGVTKLEAAAAIGRFAAKFNVPLTIGVGLYDLAHDLGFVISRKADGSPGIDVAGTTLYDNLAYFNAIPACVGMGHSGFATATAACADAASVAANTCAPAANPPNHTYTVISSAATGASCNYVSRDTYVPTGASTTNNSTFTLGVTDNSGAAGLQALQDKIAQQSGWPDSSMRTLADSVNSGQKVSVAAPTVTGPASVPGATTTKTETGLVDPANGKTGNVTTTTNTVYNNTYQTNNVTVSQVDSSSKVWNYADATTRTETTTDNKPAPDVAAASDSALPDQPTLYTKKYSDGPTGVWNTQVALIKATPLFALPGQLAPTSLGDTHSCPKWTLNLNVGISNFGNQDASIPCYVWPFLRFCIIVSALFLARSLIFGG